MRADCRVHRAGFRGQVQGKQPLSRFPDAWSWGIQLPCQGDLPRASTKRGLRNRSWSTLRLHTAQPRIVAACRPMSPECNLLSVPLRKHTNYEMTLPALCSSSGLGSNSCFPGTPGLHLSCPSASSWRSTQVQDPQQWQTPTLRAQLCLSLPPSLDPASPPQSSPCRLSSGPLTPAQHRLVSITVIFRTSHQIHRLTNSDRDAGCMQ